MRTLDAALKTATAEHKKKRAAEERERRLAERQDPRPELPAPAKTAEWLPVMRALNEVLGSVADPEPPMRDDDGFIVGIFLRRLHGAHLLTSCGANGDDSGETRLPPPEQPMLYRLNEAELSELIERYIKFVDDKGDAVHLAEPFVHHYRERKTTVPYRGCMPSPPCRSCSPMAAP